MDERSAAARSHAVRSFISRFRDEILAEWKRIARAIPVAADLPSLELADHIPDLLDEVAEIAESLADDTTTPRQVGTARRHAVDRLGAGFDVSAVVREMSMLRACMLAVWDREHADHGGAELRALDLAFDRAIAESVARYVEARDRTLAAIDRISTASLEATSLVDLLQRLLSVFMRTTEAVQTCAILLRGADGRLHTRAAVGLEQEIAMGFSLARGEGFSGHVWEVGKPVEIHAACTDPRVKSPVIIAKGVRALYGIPLVQHGEVIAVAHMGSVSASQFSQEDKQLFASMCARASVGTYHHMLRDQLAASEAQSAAAAGEREVALAKLEALVAAAPVGIAFVDRDLRYLRINDTLAAMNGRPPAEHVGRTIAEVLPAAAAARLEPLLRGVLDTGLPVMNLELHADLPSGHAHDLLVTYFPVRAGAQTIGVGGIVVDATEVHRARRALETSEARLVSIIEHAPVAIYVKDEQGRIVLTNERTAEALGVTRAELLGHRGDELVPAEFERPHRAHDLEVMRSGRAVEAEEVVPAPGGTRTFLTVKFPIPGDHGGVFVCGISTEITDRKRMEQALRAAVRAREDVLAIVSHDLRNPLAAIQFSAATLRRSVEDARMRKHLDMIQRSSARMERLLVDLLDASTIEHGGLRLELQPVRASVLVDEAADLQEPHAIEKRVALVRRCGTEAEIACDRDRVLQVFGNLIGNAIKFCPPGATITITCDPADGHVRFTVADDGPGIAPEFIPHLFEPYWSAPHHVKRGTGLGLYISRGIVQAHGGRIGVHSTPGAGTIFSFTIPVAARR